MRTGQLIFGVGADPSVSNGLSVWENLAQSIGNAAIGFGSALGAGYIKQEFGNSSGNPVVNTPATGTPATGNPAPSNSANAAANAAASSAAASNNTTFLLFGGLILAAFLVSQKR